MAMRRTQISLPEDIKRKVEKRAQAEGVSLAEILRRALVPYLVVTKGPRDFKAQLERTAGIWKAHKKSSAGHMLVNRLRKESDKRIPS